MTSLDHESLRASAEDHPRFSAGPEAAIAHVLGSVGETIDGAMEQFQQQEQLTISQLLGEISQLHKRINALESEASN